MLVRAGWARQSADRGRRSRVPETCVPTMPESTMPALETFPSLFSRFRTLPECSRTFWTFREGSRRFQKTLRPASYAWRGNWPRVPMRRTRTARRTRTRTTWKGPAIHRRPPPFTTIHCGIGVARGGPCKSTNAAVGGVASRASRAKSATTAIAHAANGARHTANGACRQGTTLLTRTSPEPPSTAPAASLAAGTAVAYHAATPSRRHRAGGQRAHSESSASKTARSSAHAHTGDLFVCVSAWYATRVRRATAPSGACS